MQLAGVKLHKKNLIFSLVALATLIVAVLWLDTLIGRNSNDSQFISIDTGWTAEVHGKRYENVTLSKDRFEILNKGDVLTISIPMPDADIESPVLLIYSIHSTIDAYLDGEKFFTYGHEYAAKNGFLGYGLSYAKVPSDYKGKELKIVFEVTENKAFEGIPAVVFADGRDYVQKYASQRIIILAISLFLIAIGIIGMFFSILSILRNTSAVKMFSVMTFAFLIGVYTLSNSDLILVFNPSVRVKSLLEYISLYTFIIPFTVYFYDWVHEIYVSKTVRRIYYTWIGVEVVFAVIAIGSQLAGIANMPVFVTPSHIVMVITLGLIIFLTINKIKGSKKMDWGLIAGFVFAVVMASLELIRFNLSKYVVGFSNNKYNSTMGYAAFIIVITLFFDFMLKITKTLREETEKKFFERLAYTDELTGLSNRRAADLLFSKLDKETKLYSIVSIDMNLLKYMNDTYGHATGDRALSTLATYLKGCFPEPCSISRVGGDEFVIIILDTNREWVEKHIDNLLNAMIDYNKKSDNVTLSIAYGIAYSDEADNSAKVFTLADQRMYVNKKETKMERS